MARDTTSATEYDDLRDITDDVVAARPSEAYGDTGVPASGTDTENRRRRAPGTRLGLCLGLAVVTILGVLLGWLGYGLRQAYSVDVQRDSYLAVARQAALNLTTIDWQNVDADIQRIVDSATGTFRDDFTGRTRPFTEVVRQAQSKSVGTVVAAALESESDEGAQVLVAVSVKTSTAVAPEQEPRNWRMRISVQQTGEGMKVSNVLFVG